MDALMDPVSSLRTFSSKSAMFIRKCTKPNRYVYHRKEVGRPFSPPLPPSVAYFSHEGNLYRDAFIHRKEFNMIASKTAIGFAMMGFIGFLVKLIFIPVNQVRNTPLLQPLIPLYTRSFAFNYPHLLVYYPSCS